VPNAAIFNPERKFDWGRFWSHARQPHVSCERASRNQENNGTNCNFRQASSKHLITLEPKIYLFFSKLLSKIYSANGFPGSLSVGQVRRESYLPEGKIYMSWTTGRGFFRTLLYIIQKIRLLYLLTVTPKMLWVLLSFNSCAIYEVHFDFAFTIL